MRRLAAIFALLLVAVVLFRYLNPSTESPDLLTPSDLASEANVAEEPEPELPFLVEIMDKAGEWTTHKTVMPQIEVWDERWRGFGPAVQLRVPDATQPEEVREVYPEWCTEWEGEGWDVECAEEERVVLRTRTININEPFRVIAAAQVYRGSTLIYQPRYYVGDPTPEEVNDPEWTSGEFEGSFTSLAELRTFAENTRDWVIIGSQAGAPLLGWKYDWPTYQLTHGGKTYVVFAMDITASEEEWATGEWTGAHIKYRYLCIGLGGHDIMYGPGCVSVFGFPQGSDTDDIEVARMVELQPDGSTTYYRDSKPDYKLEVVL